MSEQKIYEEIDGNQHYSLNVVDIPEHGRCYGVVNRQFHVIEMSTSILPNARKFLGMIEEWTNNPDNESFPDISGMN